MPGFWGRSSLEQGHSEGLIPREQVWCLLFQLVSLETWQLMKRVG